MDVQAKSSGLEKWPAITLFTQHSFVWNFGGHETLVGQENKCCYGFKKKKKKEWGEKENYWIASFHLEHSTFLFCTFKKMFRETGRSKVLNSHLYIIVAYTHYLMVFQNWAQNLQAVGYITLCKITAG